MPRAPIRLSCAIAIALCWLAPAMADERPSSGDAKALGFSSARLARIAPWYQARFDSFSSPEGLVPGAVVAIARHGKVAYLEAIGYQDRAGTIPMKVNSIFWIASMTKPVTSVAAMILVDEGKLDLDAPVGRYLPELQDMRVALQKADPTTGKKRYALGLPERAARQMTVRDLMRHTSGIVDPELEFAFPERGVADTDSEFGIRIVHGFYKWADATAYKRDTTLADFVSTLAHLPLAHQPGEVWEYGWSTEVLARVIEVASGKSFDQFLESRIFAPLHMVDTGFFVPQAKLDRLVDSPTRDRPRVWELAKPTKLFSGAGGLVSTAPDYLRFCQMLLNGGELDGSRIVSPRAIREMTTNALSPDVQIYGNEIGPLAGTTFGLGVGIRVNPISSSIPGAAGSYGWGGHWGTQFWIDPAEQLIGLQLIQAAPGQGRAAIPYAGIHYLVYGALAVPSSSPPASSTMVSVERLNDYAGTYDFGASVSSRDRQGAADGKTGWLGIERFVVMEQEGLRVNRPEPGPATKAGVAAGDFVTEIDGVPLKGLELADVAAKLRGSPNTTVRMKVLHKGQASAEDLSVLRVPRVVNAVQLQFRVEQGKLVAEATGAWPILGFEKGRVTPLAATSGSEFVAGDEDHTRVAFVKGAEGRATGVVLNPGAWEQRAAIILPGSR